MSYFITRGGVRTEITLEGRRTLAEVLSEEEYEAIVHREIAAFTPSGGLMDLSSPLEEGQEIVLRPWRSEDLAMFRPGGG